MLTKDFKFDIKEIDADTGVFEGYASTFGNTDSDGDVIEAGAFNRTLKAWEAKGKPIPVLWQHNPHEPIGITEAATEDAKGLAVRGRLLTGITKAREALEAAKANILGGLSIGFSIPKGATEWDAESKVRRIKEVRLWEYSLVTFPANEEAVLTSVKAEKFEESVQAFKDSVDQLTKLLRASASAAQREPHPSDLSGVIQQARDLKLLFQKGSL
jgi:HK97 family phage prohead protease